MRSKNDSRLNQGEIENLSRHDLYSESHYPLRKLSRYSANAKQRTPRRSRSPIAYHESERNIDERSRRNGKSRSPLRHPESERYVNRRSGRKSSRYSQRKESSRYSQNPDESGRVSQITESEYSRNGRRVEGSYRNRSELYERSEYTGRSSQFDEGVEASRRAGNYYDRNMKNQRQKNRSELIESHLQHKKRFDAESQYSDRRNRKSQIDSKKKSKKGKVDYEEYLRQRYPDLASVKRERSRTRSPIVSQISRQV